MKGFFQRIGNALTSAYDSGWDLLLANVLWIVTTLLAFGLSYGLTALVDLLVEGGDALVNLLFYLLLVVTFSIPLGGLFHVAHQIVEGQYDGARAFLTGMRLHAWTALRWLAMNALVVYALNFYITAFLGQGAVLKMIVVSLAYSALVWWTLTQIYALPLALYQEKPSLLRAMRNSLVIYVKSPGLVFGIAVLIVLLAILSVVLWPLVFVLSGSLIAFLATYAVARVLEMLEGRDQPPASEISGGDGA